MSETKMVVGLGNPGSEYVGTRHNVGFMVIDLLADALKMEVRKRKFGAVFGSSEVAGKKVVLLKPRQFMNCSGRPVAKAVSFFELDVSELLVITDDMALPPGAIRVRAKGSSGGHKGLADVLERLGVENVARLRIGIGPSDNADAVDYVLDKPTQAERPLLDEAILMARQAALYWVEHGIEATMNKYN